MTPPPTIRGVVSERGRPPHTTGHCHGTKVRPRILTPNPKIRPRSVPSPPQTTLNLECPNPKPSGKTPPPPPERCCAHSATHLGTTGSARPTIRATPVGATPQPTNHEPTALDLVRDTASSPPPPTVVDTTLADPHPNNLSLASAKTGCVSSTRIPGSPTKPRPEHHHCGSKRKSALRVYCCCSSASTPTAASGPGRARVPRPAPTVSPPTRTARSSRPGLSAVTSPFPRQREVLRHRFSVLLNPTNRQIQRAVLLAQPSDHLEVTVLQRRVSRSEPEAGRRHHHLGGLKMALPEREPLAPGDIDPAPRPIAHSRI